MAVVITTCTNRKRKPIDEGLCASSLANGSVGEVARQWGRQLRADVPRYSAMEVYGGRSFKDAIEAAKALDANLFVVSAGLGLIDAENQIPAYACTVLEGAPDSISARIGGFHPKADWWRELQRVSPYALPFRVVAGADDTPILASLSDNYIEMVAAEVMDLPIDRVARLRLFTRAPISRIPEGLRGNVMPYDDRLDGPDSSIRGTRSDFAARALRHFVGLRVSGSASEDAAAVEVALADWRIPSKFDRIRRDDAELLDLMRQHWAAAGGRSSKLLRFFRDDLGVACEQGRFAALARQVREERA